MSYALSDPGLKATIEKGENAEYCPFSNFHLYANLTNLSSNNALSVSIVFSTKPIFNADLGFFFITVISSVDRSNQVASYKTWVLSVAGSNLTLSLVK